MTFEDRLLVTAGVRARWPEASWQRVALVSFTATAGATVTLVLRPSERSPDPLAGATLELRLRGARGRLPEAGEILGGPGLMIDDLSADQLEGVRYHVHDDGEHLRLWAAAVELHLREPLEDAGG